MSQYLSTIARMSPQERFDMMDLGLNSLNPEHIKMYKSGNVKIDMKENVEYIKSVVGYDIDMSQDLGHGKHRDENPQEGSEYSGGGVYETKRRSDPKSVRQNLMEDMDDMVESTAARSSQMTSKLLSISQRKQGQRPQQQASGDKLEEAVRVGKDRSTNFHNAYIRCIQNPTTQGYMEVYKALKTMLEQEQKLTNAGSSLLKYYKKGINEVTGNMYKKITKQIND